MKAKRNRARVEARVAGHIARIRELAGQGFTDARIGFELGLSRQWVKILRHRADPPIPPGFRRSPTPRPEGAPRRLYPSRFDLEDTDEM